MVNLNKIITTIINAGIEVLNIYVSNELNVSYKADNSPLTQADKNAHQIICKGLESTGLPVLSEEGKQLPYSSRANWDSYWLIDPLDGTKEFINHNGEFTINIALIEKGIAVAGFVYVPIYDKLYIGATKSELFSDHGYKFPGAYRIDNAKDTPKSMVLPDINKESIVVLGSRSHMNEETQIYIDNLKKKHPDMTFESRGSSLKICALAEGSAHYYPRFAPTMEWDTAAAHAVLSASGGKIINYDTKKEVEYNKESLLNPHFLATAKGF